MLLTLKCIASHRIDGILSRISTHRILGACCFQSIASHRPVAMWRIYRIAWLSMSPHSLLHRTWRSKVMNSWILQLLKFVRPWYLDFERLLFRECLLAIPGLLNYWLLKDVSTLKSWIPEFLTYCKYLLWTNFVMLVQMMLFSLMFEIIKFRTVQVATIQCLNVWNLEFLKSLKRLQWFKVSPLQNLWISEMQKIIDTCLNLWPHVNSPGPP